MFLDLFVKAVFFGVKNSKREVLLCEMKKNFHFLQKIDSPCRKRVRITICFGLMDCLVSFRYSSSMWLPWVQYSVFFLHGFIRHAYFVGTVYKNWKAAKTCLRMTVRRDSWFSVFDTWQMGELYRSLWLYCVVHASFLALVISPVGWYVQAEITSANSLKSDWFFC